jgi:hypothetical protein
LELITVNTAVEGCHRWSSLPPHHPSLPYPVLQYADDKLILIKGDIDGVTNLKNILDSFSPATGLHINFHKSTFIPMHINGDAAGLMANHLGCAVSSFP